MLEYVLYFEREWITTCLVFVCTFLMVYYNTKRPKGVPPGPALYPLIGNLPSFAGNILENLASLRNQFGDIYSLYMGKELMVFFNGYDVIHDALVKKGTLFSMRPLSSYDRLVVQNPGIAFSNGTLWKQQRKIVMEALQELCFSKGSSYTELLVQNEVEHLLKVVKQQKDAFDIEHYLTVGVSNVICTLMFNHRFDYEDEVIKNNISITRENASLFTYCHTLVNCLPFLHHLPFDILKVNRLQNNFHQSLENFQPYMDRIKDKHVKGNRDTFIDIYIDAFEKSVDPKDIRTKGEFSAYMRQLNATAFDLFAAGSETTANTLRWFLIYMIRYPDVQERMFEEIDRVIGREPPQLIHRKHLPYVQAVIHEILRTAITAPLAIPHSVTDDTEFHGYHLPRGCTVMINLVSCLKDPTVWNDPEVFNPDRFINEEKTGVRDPKEFIPFSIGPRSCIGESLAKIELFVFATTLVQHFRFHSARESELPSLQGTFGITWSPNTFKIRVEKRCH